jgi:hypothetical protein
VQLDLLDPQNHADQGGDGEDQALEEVEDPHILERHVHQANVDEQ